MSNATIIESIRARMHNLSELQLHELERHAIELELLNGGPPPNLCKPNLDWPHAPLHKLGNRGTYIVTGATLHKQHLFRSATKLDLLQHSLLSIGKESGWHLEAWACFSNHYHLVARAEKALCALGDFLDRLHSSTAKAVNEIDGQPQRPVWFNYFDTRLTYHNSYMARLNYVHQNAVRHRLVSVANQYPWCSVSWFERTATPAQVRTVYSFKTDRLAIDDDYDGLTTPQ